MTAALALLGYAIAAAWWSPVLLGRLTGSGASVRPGLAAWLSAMASVVVAAGLGAAGIAQTAAAEWPTLTRLLCQGVAGTACTPQVYGSMAYSAGVAILAVLVTLAALAALWRYGRRTQRAVDTLRAERVGTAHPGPKSRARTVAPQVIEQASDARVAGPPAAKHP